MDVLCHVHSSLRASLGNLLFTMDSAASSAHTSSTASFPSRKGRRRSGPYRGVRMRAWGKWVSEIRIPKTGKRIWLGSYDSPEKAARAYDAAQFCIRGMHASFNFPAEERPELPQGYLDPLSKKEIQTIAMNYASSDLPVHAPASSPVTNQVSIDTPAIPNALNSGATTTASETVHEYTPVSAAVAEPPLFENLVLDDFLMLDIEWISEIM
ncbi:hypothetical protein SLEP1_g30636 [Rubroshorea leprosula]|uniref:AP2/ERF domain-containing protein n=2 Tax=Rubroshorea leprosula TaxID=152421 RepID=A0AAV5K0S3_9ROSI|nr:hypothetical protein SLEP1_g30636 [Rubroshorea leprosula]